VILWTEVSSGNWEGTPSVGGNINAIGVWEHKDRVGWYWKVLTDDASDDAPEGFSSTLDAARMHAGTAYMEWYGYSCLVGELEVSLQALKEENAMLRDERRIDNEEAARLYDFARNKGEALERQAVVEWLRAEAEAVAQTYTTQAGEWAKRIDDMAEAIERGEHRREEGA